MVDAKDVADSAKTADYYLKRIKDLPSLMREKFAYLRNEAKSKRILILSIQDLCTLLDLEYKGNTILDYRMVYCTFIDAF